MTVLTRHSALRGLLAPLVALAATCVAALFLFTRAGDGGPVLVAWAVATVAPLLGVVLMRRFRDRPATGAGLFGLLTWLVCFTTLARLGAESDFVSFGALGGGLVVSATAGILAEWPAVMRDPTLPSNATRALSLCVMLGSVLGATLIACPISSPIPSRLLGEPIGSLEIPALPAVVRERFSRPDHRDVLEIEVTSTPATGGGATAALALSVDDHGELAQQGSEPCVLDVPPMGRTVDVLASDELYEIRWPTSPHGETFDSCTFARASLVRVDATLRTQTSSVSWALVVAPFYGLLALGLAWRLRRRHARIGRSPEVRVTEPGVAVMPDGAPAVVSAEIPMGTTIVALRLADVRPDYRADARHVIEEHAIGEKAALLVDLARRVRTLELTAFGGVALLSSVVLASWLGGAVLGY